MNEHAVLRETPANRELFARVLIGEIDAVVEPLLHLDERSRASIVALVGAAQLVTAYEHSLTHAGDSIGNDFDLVLYGLHPEGAALLAGLRTSGFAESVAYGWTLALRRSISTDGSTHSAAHTAAAEVACAMNHLDALMDVLRRLRLPAPVASDGPRGTPAELLDFPHDWQPVSQDM
jgi:hypothetical protein